ncbi:MAG: decaprenyl-phosphate phosphoribosyltransferase [Kiritimatiellia bacterium]|jgi:4-hydroxybenzoate polyprenyltransferase
MNKNTNQFGALARAMLEVTRPAQWLKNLLVFAGFFFALADKLQPFGVAESLQRSVLAFALFCAISGAVYIMNDLHDAEADRLHPEKCKRPIASGRLPPKVAVAECAVLVAAALGLSALLGPLFAVCLAGYFLMQAAYTHGLKDVVLVDVFIVAIGFVARVYVGTIAAGVAASSWLVLCTFMAALFLILCKRYDEKVALGDDAVAHRKVLADYTPALLSHLIAIAATCTILCYALYTLAPATVAKYGTERLVLTVPFVVFGIFRYMFLTFCRGQGGRPERTLVRDAPLVLTMALYAAVYAVVMLLA